MQMMTRARQRLGEISCIDSAAGVTPRGSQSIPAVADQTNAAPAALRDRRCRVRGAQDQACPYFFLAMFSATKEIAAMTM